MKTQLVAFYQMKWKVIWINRNSPDREKMGMIRKTKIQKIIISIKTKEEKEGILAKFTTSENRITNNLSKDTPRINSKTSNKCLNFLWEWEDNLCLLTLCNNNSNNNINSKEEKTNTEAKNKIIEENINSLTWWTKICLLISTIKTLPKCSLWNSKGFHTKKKASKASNHITTSLHRTPEVRTKTTKENNRRINFSNQTWDSLKDSIYRIKWVKKCGDRTSLLKIKFFSQTSGVSLSKN